MDIDYIDNEAIDIAIHMQNVEMNHNDDMNLDMNDAEECHNCHGISAIFEEDSIKDDKFELYRVTIELCNDVVIKFCKKFSSILQRDYNHEEPLLLCHECLDYLTSGRYVKRYSYEFSIPCINVESIVE